MSEQFRFRHLIPGELHNLRRFVRFRFQLIENLDIRLFIKINHH